jgi:hypothetical protein
MSKNTRLGFIGGFCLLALTTLLIGTPLIPRSGGQMSVTLVNNDPFGNNFRVIDKNAGDAELFNGYIEPHGERSITCRQNDSDYGNIATSEDGKAYIGRSFLKPNDRVNL